MRLARQALPALALLLAACGGGGGGSAPSGLPSERWTWVDVPGTACSDGSVTGIAVNPAPATSQDSMVLVFLNGGGACWGSGPFACGGFTATPGPYGAAEFQTDLPSLDATILDRTIVGTPFAGATLVFVPYCTGDVHWGASAPSYPLYGVWHHAGAANLAADVAWLKAHLDAPARLVVIGSSAGGFGTLLAHDLARTAWPDARGYLVDDSGPPLVGSDVPDAERSGWYASWNLDATLGPRCGDACKTDLSQALAALQAKYPDDRLALLSSLQDGIISAFLGYSTGSDYQAALLRLVDARFPATATGAHAFLVGGSGHALLSGPAAQNADGTALPDWLREMVDDEAGWTTLGRP